MLSPIFTYEAEHVAKEEEERGFEIVEIARAAELGPLVLRRSRRQLSARTCGRHLEKVRLQSTTFVRSSRRSERVWDWILKDSSARKPLRCPCRALVSSVLDWAPKYWGGGGGMPSSLKMSETRLGRIEWRQQQSNEMTYSDLLLPRQLFFFRKGCRITGMKRDSSSMPERRLARPLVRDRSDPIRFDPISGSSISPPTRPLYSPPFTSPAVPAAQPLSPSPRAAALDDDPDDVRQKLHAQYSN